MKIRFLGPIGRVTGSCYWLRNEASGVEFLVDCGLVQGHPGGEDWNEGPFPFDPARIDFVVLTHAHLDHCGLLPRLVAEGFSGPVYCTEPTAHLARLSLVDSARRSTSFAAEHVEAIDFRTPAGRGGQLGRAFPVRRDLYLTFFRSGHVLGAVSVHVRWERPPGNGRQSEQRSILFSGDIGPDCEDREELPILGHRMMPIAADFAVLESTYGGRERRPVDATRIARLHRWRRVLDCAEQANGRVLVPAFAMQRTQDVLFDLHDLFAEDGYAGLQVFLDSPMAERVNEVFAEYMLQWDSASSSGEQFVWLGQQLFRRFRLDPHDAIDRELASWMVGEVLRPDGPEPRLSWRAANRKAAHALPSVRCWRRIYTSLPPGATVAAGSVVVAGSGMCTGGRILTHLERHLDDSNAAVVFAGYAGPHTLAGQLQRAWSERGHTSAADQPIAWPDNEPRRITRLPQIRAAALRIPGYSGHADGPNLASYVFDVPGAPVIAPRVFLTHGDDQARHCLRAALIRLARKRSTPLAVEVPDHTSAWFDLDRDSWCHDDRFADPHACA